MVFTLFTIGSEPRTTARDWNWFLAQITPKMRHALANEAYRILRNKDDVEDVMQESLIIGCTKCHQLRDETKLFQWMFKIVRRAAYDHQSHFSISRLAERVKDIFLPLPAHPEELLIDAQEYAILHQAVNSLDEHSRKIVLLKTTTNMNLKEIALQLNLNYNTVRSKYQRALDTLKRCMEEEYGEKND